MLLPVDRHEGASLLNVLKKWLSLKMLLTFIFHVQKKEINCGIFHKASDPPTPLVEKKIKKTKNDLLAMKQILYDMGPLTLVRWPL